MTASPPTRPVRLAVVGAGLVGQRHAELAAGHPDVDLIAIVDPDPGRNDLADQLGCELAASIDQIPDEACDAAIIATPNSDHLASGLACLARKWPCLIEKPVADSIDNGERLVRAFDRQGIALLIGHHRRYHPFVDRARGIIQSRELGDPVMASIIWAVRKPDAYFRQGAWRLGADGGPLLINLIHELDLMLSIFGPVREVQAIASNARRGGAVEDSAAIALRFENAMLATVMLSDAALTPWSFEGASGENPNIAPTGAASWRVGCTQGAFDFPSLNIWRPGKPGEGDWSRPLETARIATQPVDPLRAQLQHFASLVRGETRTPQVSGQDGLEALRLLTAIKQAAELQVAVQLPTRNTRQVPGDHQETNEKWR